MPSIETRTILNNDKPAIRGYLDSDTTLAYIEKIGDQSCHIEFYSDGIEDGYFCNKDRTPYLTASGQPVSTVDEMLDYIKQNF